MDRDQLHADLKAVRQLLDAGWCQGHWVNVTDQGTKYCLRGAVRKVAGVTSVDSYLSPKAYVMCDALYVQLRQLTDSTMTYWNDHPFRKKQDVLDLVDETIANLDEIVTQLEGE